MGESVFPEVPELDVLSQKSHATLMTGIGAAMYVIIDNLKDTEYQSGLAFEPEGLLSETWEVRCVNKDTGRHGRLTLGFVDGPPEVEVYAESGYWQYCPSDLFGNQTEITGAVVEAFLMMLAVMRVPRIDDATNL
jgi:hypothetical protein